MTRARASVPSAACRCLTATDVFEHIPKSLPAASNKTTAKTSCSLYPSHRETHVCLQTSVIVLHACLTTRQRRRRRRVENNIIYQQRRRRRRRRRHHEVKASWRDNEGDAKVEIIITAVEIISTAVETFPPRWKQFHRGEIIITAVEIISTAVETFPPRWKHFHRGGNILTAVEIVFHLIHNFPLDSLQRNFRDFIVFT